MTMMMGVYMHITTELTSQEKWKFFKNYMHNELCITKDDIRDWIKEAVKDIAERMVAQEYEKFNIRDYLEQFIVDNENLFRNKTLNRELKQLIADRLFQQFELKLKS